MVSPIAGTTRDAVDSIVEHEGLTVRFIDTAGIRRKGKTELKAEKLSVVMARRHLGAKRCRDSCHRRTAGRHRARRPHRRLRARGRPVGHHRRQQVGPGGEARTASRPSSSGRFARNSNFFLLRRSSSFPRRPASASRNCMELIEEVHKARFVRVPTRELNEFLRQEVLIERRTSLGR